MFKISGNKISLTRGDSLYLDVKLFKDKVAYTPEANDTIRFTMKKNISDEESILEKQLDINGDVATLHIEPDDTKYLQFGRYKYDMELNDSMGDVYTFIIGEFEVTGEVR